MPLTYKSFCWCLGTTSFRTKNFNRTIEEQLVLLNEFWSKPDNAEVGWRNNNNIQMEYYLFMQDKGFVEAMQTISLKTLVKRHRDWSMLD